MSTEKDTSMDVDVSPEKGTTPDEDMSIKKNVSPVKNTTPDKNKSPEKDKSPEKIKTPEKVETPEKVKSLEKGKTPEKADTQDAAKSPEKDESPEKEGTPEKDTSAEKPSSPPEPAFLKIKEKYLSMSLEERRENYDEDVTLLDEIDSWDVYCKKHADRLRKYNKNGYKKHFGIKDYKPKLDLCKKVSIWRGDITALEVDAIVNAANNSLLGGGGVDGAIHRAAGRCLLAECRTLNGCPTGEAKIAGGYELPAKYVILTVGPIGEKPDLLESCYKESLQRMVENDLRSIAFPCISTGIYGYPQDRAANVALATVRDFLENNASKVDRVIFCLFLPDDVEIYEIAMQIFFPIQ